MIFSFIKRIFYIFVYLRYKLAKITRLYPRRIEVQGGSIDYDINSRIIMRGNSTLKVKGDLHIENTTLILSETVFNCENLSLKNGYIQCENSQILMGHNGFVTDVDLKAKNCTINLSDNFKISNQRFTFKNSKITSGIYLCINGENDPNSIFNISASDLLMGDNVNLKCRLNCKNSKMILGDNIFVNQGTEIRCENCIRIGCNVFISYDCLILDTNTHSTDPIARAMEIEQGYPNSTVKTEKSLPLTAPIEIGKNVWIGMRAAVLKGTSIGDNSVVGLMSVVSGTFPEYSLIAGNPGQIKKIIKHS